MGKMLTKLEIPDEQPAAPPAPAAPAPAPAATASQTIPLPPIPAPPRREVMVQLSIKAPLDLVQRLERMREATGSHKQALIAAAVDAYLAGHGY